MSDASPTALAAKLGHLIAAAGLNPANFLHLPLILTIFKSMFGRNAIDGSDDRERISDAAARALSHPGDNQHETDFRVTLAGDYNPAFNQAQRETWKHILSKQLYDQEKSEAYKTALLSNLPPTVLGRIADADGTHGAELWTLLGRCEDLAGIQHITDAMIAECFADLHFPHLMPIEDFIRRFQRTLQFLTNAGHRPSVEWI